jgi:hypothetical protein
MFKELFLAVILGALLGFGITGGVLALKNNKKTTPTVPTTTALPTISGTITTSPKNTIDSSTLDTNNHQITIESPGNESIVANSKVTIKGSTTAQSSLVISTSSQTYFATADNAGNFNVDIDVDSGVNQIQIDSIDSQDNQATAQLIITYSTTKI